MKRPIATIASIALCLGVLTSVAQARLGVSESDYALATEWLQTNCLAPSARSLIARLLERREAMQRAFLAAIEEGPTEAEIAARRDAATALYRRQREFIEHPTLRDSIPPEVLRTVASTHEGEFVGAEVANYVNGYRSNAMAGLAIVGDETAIQRLAALARDPAHPLAAAANAALSYRSSLSEIPRPAR
jgi:hypothetical protein